MRKALLKKASTRAELVRTRTVLVRTRRFTRSGTRAVLVRTREYSCVY